MPLEPAGAPPRPGPSRQLSLFGVEAGDPSPADLAGLLAGPGEVVRMGGTARVSVTVDEAWRVHVLAAEFARRGLATTWLPQPGGGYGVRTAYTGLLAPLARAWLRAVEEAPPGPGDARPHAGGKRPPPKFHLNGHRLRLWLAAAGNVEPLGFLLRLGAGDEACWDAVGAALAAVGLPAVLVTPRVVARTIPSPSPPEEPDMSETPTPEDPEQAAKEAMEEAGEEAGEQAGEEAAPPPPVRLGPAYRITGRRRLSRLAELVGERPPAAPVHAWPGADA